MTAPIYILTEAQRKQLLSDVRLLAICANLDHDETHSMKLLQALEPVTQEHIAIDKEVAAGTLVRTGPFTWTRTT